MNEEEAAFIEAILNEADDHVSRLAYADWLNERDDPRESRVRQQGELGPSIFTPVSGKLVPLPAGTFLMGSPETERYRDPDEPAHEVTLTQPFYLGATPVTVGEFREFVESTGYESVAELTAGVGWNSAIGHWERGAYRWSEPGWEQDDDEPAVCLAWEDARAFCKWMSDLDGREYRLPTEAEWEYACRAWTATPFSFGDELTPNHANYDHRYPYDRERRGTEGPGRTTPVGSYPANAFGLFDMHGNVWEWVLDWYDYSFYAAGQRDPSGPATGYGRVLRGGAWCTPASDCRSALRRCGHLSFSRYHDGATGFRVALSMPQPEKRRRKKAMGHG